jgi:hypothetical protein
MTTDRAAVLSRTYRVGTRLQVTFTSPRPERGVVLHMVAEWSPDVPERLTAREAEDYRAARADFMVELAGLVRAGG